MKPHDAASSLLHFAGIGCFGAAAGGGEGFGVELGSGMGAAPIGGFTGLSMAVMGPGVPGSARATGAVAGLPAAAVVAAGVMPAFVDAFVGAAEALELATVV